MSFSAFNKRAQSTTVNNSTHQGTQQSEVSGTAASINGNSNTMTILDGGAIAQAFGFGNSALEFGANALDKSAALTLGLVEKQAAANSEAMAAGFRFAMDAGRSDVAVMNNTMKAAVAVVAVVALAWAWSKAKK